MPGLCGSDKKKLAAIGIDLLAQLVETDINQIPNLFRNAGIELSKNNKIELYKCLKSLPLFNLTWKAVVDKNKEKEESLWGDQGDFAEDSIVEVEVSIENINKNASRRAAMSKSGRMQEIGLWIIIGCTNNNKVLVIKKLQFPKKHISNYFLTIQVPSNPNLSLYLIHDAYLGLDQEYRIN